MAGKVRRLMRRLVETILIALVTVVFLVSCTSQLPSSSETINVTNPGATDLNGNLIAVLSPHSSSVGAYVSDWLDKHKDATIISISYKPVDDGVVIITILWREK